MSKEKWLEEVEEWFNNRSEEEIEEKLRQYGFFDRLEETPKQTPKLSSIDKLENLYEDIKKKGEYLENYTYSQYDHCYEFANRLKEIIEEIKEKHI